MPRKEGAMSRFRKFQRALCATLAIVMAFGALAAIPITATGSPEILYDAVVGVAEGTLAFSVGTPEELASLQFAVGKTNYVELTADIDMSGVDFTPLNASLPAPDSSGFADEQGCAVVFEGNGHTISNLTVSTNSRPGGLFMYLYNGSVVRNLHFKNIDVTTSGLPHAAGAVAGLSAGRVTLYHVTVDNTSSLHATNGFAGGLVGMIWDETGRASDAAGTSISYCINEATVSGRNRVGGLVGSYQSMDPLTFRYCINRGAVSNLIGYVTTPGGLLGTALSCNKGTVAEDYTGKPYVFDHCVNEGTLTVNHAGGGYYTGGIVGEMGDRAASTTLTLSHCYDTSSRARDGGGGTATHGALLGTDSCPTLYVTDCMATGADYTLLTANNDVYIDENLTISTDDAARTKVAAEIARIRSWITSAGTLPAMAVSTESKNLSLRIKLTEPYGFMAITSLSWADEILPVAEYDQYVNGVGFVFLRSDHPVTEAELMVEGTRVKGTPYAVDAKGKTFCAAYESDADDTLGDTVFFAAYVERAGCLFLSETRSICPIRSIATLAAEHSELPSAEKEIYQTMVEQYEAKHGSLEAKKSLKVATYNIYHCADVTKIDHSVNSSDVYWAFTDTIVNSDNIANVIHKNGIEICGLNETTAYAKTYGDGDTAQAERIANKLGALTGQTYYWGFAPAQIGGYANRGDPDGAFGNSIVSKYPILSVKSYAIGSPKYHRCLLLAEIDVDGTTVTVMVSHFDNTSASERTLGVEAVRELKKGIATPTILMGDFNEAPGNVNGTYNALKALYTPTAKTDAQVPYTHPSDDPRTTYDYILHSPDITSEDLHTDPTALCSDHLPVIATLYLPTAD